MREFFFGVDPDGAEIRSHVIAEDALDEIQIAMEERRGFALLGARLDFLPRAHQEFDVGFYFFVGGASCGGANDESAATLALGFIDEMAQASAIFGGSDFARDAGVIERRHVDEDSGREERRGW